MHLWYVINYSAKGNKKKERAHVSVLHNKYWNSKLFKIEDTWEYKYENSSVQQVFSSTVPPKWSFNRKSLKNTPYKKLAIVKKKPLLYNVHLWISVVGRIVIIEAARKKQTSKVDNALLSVSHMMNKNQLSNRLQYTGRFYTLCFNALFSSWINSS